MSTVNFDDGASDSYNLNTLGRWTRQFSERSSVELQAYYDRTHRNDIFQARTSSDTFDITAQHTFGLGARNDVIWGLGYRYIGNTVEQTLPAIQVRNAEVDLHLFNVFVQDEFHLVPDKLTLTAGVKVEHNDYTGFELQPSLRAVFKPTHQQTLWASVSRAVRTPDAFEGKDLVGITVAPPFFGPGGGFYLPTLVGNAGSTSEVLWAYELGYRIQPAKRVSVDLAAFYNEYSDLISYGDVKRFVPGVPFGIAEIPASNILSAETYGGEVSATVAATETLRFTASYSLLIVQAHAIEHSIFALPEKSAPKHQITLRSSYDFTKRASLDVQVRYMDQIDLVASYVTADVRLSYRPTDRLEVSLVGQNLLDKQHPEQGATPFAVTAEVPRGVFGKLSWKF